MNKTLRHTVVFFLASIVLLATTGVSVHKLYCYCKGEMVASVFPPDDPCGMADSAKKDCCKKMEACAKSNASKKNGCSDCRSEFVKLDVKYLVFSIDFQLHAPAAAFLGHHLVKEFVPLSLSSKIAWENDLPPPAGKDLLPWIQSFLC